MQVPTILLVDDDAVDAEVVARAFRQQKLANVLVYAIDGIEALEILRGRPGQNPLPKPYIILLDINMPRMNGLEFLHELRQDPDLSDSVVFILTTSESVDDRMLAYKEHVAGYILKQHVGIGFVNAIHLLENYQMLVVLPE